MTNKCPSRTSCSSCLPGAVDSGECHQSLHNDFPVGTDDDDGDDFGDLFSMAASDPTVPHSSSSPSGPVFRPSRRNSFGLWVTIQGPSWPVLSPTVDGRPSRRRGVACGHTCRVGADWRQDRLTLDRWRCGLPFYLDENEETIMLL